MNKIRRPEFSEAWQAFGPRIDSEADLVILYDPEEENGVRVMVATIFETLPGRQLTLELLAQPYLRLLVVEN